MTRLLDVVKEKCPTPKKRLHFWEQDAIVHARQVERDRGQEAEAYRCECGFWHVRRKR